MVIQEAALGAAEPFKRRLRNGARRTGLWAAKWGSAAVAAKAGFQGKFETALLNGTADGFHQLKWSAVVEPIQHAVSTNPWLFVLSLAGISATVLASRVQQKTR